MRRVRTTTILGASIDFFYFDVSSAIVRDQACDFERKKNHCSSIGTGRTLRMLKYEYWCTTKGTENTCRQTCLRDESSSRR